MEKYILIEPHSSINSHSVDHFMDLAATLATEGNQVTLYLVCEGVTPLRGGPYRDRVEAVAAMGVDVRADNGSLEIRKLTHEGLPNGVSSGNPTYLAQRILEGYKAIWHGGR